MHDSLGVLTEPSLNEARLRGKEPPTHVSFVTTVMASILFAMIHVQAREVTGSSWSELEKRGGYYTEEGTWRGGFPWMAHRAEKTLEVCSDRRRSANGTFCQSWEIERGREWASKIGFCHCSRHIDAYCDSWRCSFSSENSNGFCQSLRTHHCLQLLNEEKVKSCDCMEAAENGMHCQRWRCLTNDASGGNPEEGQYHCLSSNSLNTSCQKWVGEWNSEKEVQSDVCECEQEGDGHCHAYWCKTKSMIRCSEQWGGWCHLEISIGLYGTLGCFFLLIGMMMHWTHCANRHANVTRAIVVCSLIVILVILLFAVALTGGEYGLSWVALMWFVCFLVLVSVRMLLKAQRVRSSSLMQDPNALLPPDEYGIHPYLFNGRFYP